MPCPDELTLDLWLAGALPSEEATAVAAHVRTCADCVAAEQAARAIGGGLQAALALDADEQAYLSGLELAAPWRTSPSPSAGVWGWLALAVVVGGYVAWTAGASLLGPVIGTAAWISLGVAPLNLALEPLFDFGAGLLDVARHPALSLSQPLLALIALALLAWPRQSTARRSAAA